MHKNVMVSLFQRMESHQPLDQWIDIIAFLTTQKRKLITESRNISKKKKRHVLSFTRHTINENNMLEEGFWRRHNWNKKRHISRSSKSVDTRWMLKKFKLKKIAYQIKPHCKTKIGYIGHPSPETPPAHFHPVIDRRKYGVQKGSADWTTSYNTCFRLMIRP